MLAGRDSDDACTCLQYEKMRECGFRENDAVFGSGRATAAASL